MTTAARNQKKTQYQPNSTIPVALPISTLGMTINLATQVTGTLSDAHGGTGVTTSTGSGSVVLNISPTITTSLIMADAANIVANATTGTKIGTATNQKISFWNASPVIQPASANQAALSLDSDVTGADTVDLAAVNANFTAIQTLVNQLRADLVTEGLIKGAA